jgi:hypothetical protein
MSLGKNPGTGWMGTKVGLDIMESDINLLPLPGFKPQIIEPIVQPLLLN